MGYIYIIVTYGIGWRGAVETNGSVTSIAVVVLLTVVTILTEVSVGRVMS